MMIWENFSPMPVSWMVPTMMPMTPTVAPMIRVLSAPSRMVFRISRGPIRWSEVRQLTPTHDRTAQKAA
jgi:hypothetical protein